MPRQNALRNLVPYVWKAPLCALAYTAATVISGMLLAQMRIPLPKMPPEADPKRLLGVGLFASLMLALGLGPLATQLQGGYLVRSAILASLMYISMGLNGAIESSVFTTLGGTPGAIAMFVLPSLAVAALVAALFRPSQRGMPFGASLASHFSERSAVEWTWRLVAAVLAFPVIYFAFGMCVGPLVVGHYTSGDFGLKLPTMPVIIRTQMIRSSLFVLAALPVLVSWSGTKRHLGAALGIALYVLVAALGLTQAYWMPISLRAPHAIETLADSLAHSFALVTLLGRKGK